MTIGQVVRALRRERGLAAYVFCHQAGVSPRTLRLLEKQNRLPLRIDTRQRIAVALGVPYNQLWTDHKGESDNDISRGE